MSIIKRIRKKQNIKFLEKHPAFCVLAFAHLRVQITNYDVWEDQMKGRVGSLCCSALDPVEVELNDSLNDIIQHENFKQDREMFYADKLPPSCENVCSLNYKNTTKREIVNEVHIDTISYKKVFKQPKLKVIDYNFGNECNLACRMCSAGSSNQIAVLASKAVSSIDNTTKLIEFGINDLEQQGDIEKNIENLKNGVFLRRSVPSDQEAIKEALPNLNELQFAGGEPFVSKDVEDILLAAIETGDNKHINLEITTNGTKFVEEKLDIFLKFKTVNFIVSIDGVNSTYDYIRSPFKFSLIEKRLKGIVDYIIKNNLENKVKFHFACIGILYNLYDYEKLYSFLNDIFGTITTDTEPVSMIIMDAYGTHDDAHALSWNNIPNDLLNDALFSYKDTQDDWYLKFKEYVINRTQNAQPKGILYAKEHTLLLDNLHGRNYQDYLDLRIIKYIDSISTK